MITPLVILGAGGFARETLDVVDAINAVSPTWDMLGFLVDAQYGEAGTIVNGKPILGELSWLAENPDVRVVCGVGAPEHRLKLTQRAAEFGIQFCTLIHPNVTMSQWITIGEGTIITAGCILTNSIVIGKHVHVNLNCTIGHDVTMDEFVTLAPGVHVSGNVHIQQGCYVGTGANIIEKKTIGDWSIVGAG